MPITTVLYVWPPQVNEPFETTGLVQLTKENELELGTDELELLLELLLLLPLQLLLGKPPMSVLH